MEHTEQVLKEYELCQDTVAKLEDTIWKTSAAIGLGSLGTLVLVISQREKLEWQSILVVGLLVSVTSLVWWFMAKRWWDIQHATFLRMKHLEEELHYYQTRYIYHKDGKCDLQPSGSALSQPQIDELNTVINKKFHLRGVQSWLRLLPYYFVPIAWGEYIFSKWNNESAFYNTQCLEQFLIYVSANVVPFLLVIIGNLIYIRTENCDRSIIVAARYKNKKKNGE